MTTDQYAIYAHNPKNAEALHSWLGDELAEAQVRYGTAIGRGLVLAIESLEEPVAELDAWRAQNVDRYREINWVDPFTRSDFHGFGRPYCWSNEPYFTESYALPVDVALKLGLLSEKDLRPQWICVLTTDAHRLNTFDRELGRSRTERLTKMQEPGVKDLLAKESASMLLAWFAIYGAVQMFHIPQYSTIDHELMHLQRRETVFGAIITAAIEDGSARNSALSSLRDEIDELWKPLFLDRPVE